MWRDEVRESTMEEELNNVEKRVALGAEGN